jgi:hypothetical protein
MSGIFDQIINYSPPLIVSGTVNYDGTWDASTNTPTLNNPPAASTKGDYYVVSVAGTQFGLSFAVGDWIISNGTAWEKVDLTDAVSSVFGRTGAVVGVSTDYSAVGLTNTAIGASSPSTGAFTTVSASTPIAVASGGTGVTTSTGTTNVVLSNSPTLVTPILGTPQSGTLSSCTGLPISTGVSGLGTGIATALAVNTGSAGAPVLFNGALGTPTSGTVTNLTGTASININGTVGATTPSTVAATTATVANNSGYIAAPANTVLHVVGANGTNARIHQDTYGTNPIYAQRQAEGTAASPTATINTRAIGFWGASGYGATGFPSLSSGAMIFSATENFTDSAQGTNFRVQITPNGSATRSTVLTADSTGLAVTGALSSTTGANFATSSGSVGIGTASPSRPLDVRGSLGMQVNEDNAGTKVISIRSDFAGAGPAINVTTNDPLLFLTNATERARIDSSGNLLVGTTSAGGKLVVTQGASSTNAILVDIASSTTKFAEFTFTGSNVGSISYNGTNTVFSTTSDYRLKDITGPLVDSGSFIDALKPKVGTWKSNGSKFVGFLAHEFAEVSPTSVCGEKDAVDADGKPVYQAMQASSAEVIANLVAELQSLRARVDALESK